MKPYLANFLFHGTLNDFLIHGNAGQWVDYRFQGHPAIKDPIETIGVPHSEIDLILVDDKPVTFDYLLQNGDRVLVYPDSGSPPTQPGTRLQPAALAVMRFMADVNLGKLARKLRMLGFDTAYSNRLDDNVLVQQALAERRIILTRDRRLLFRKAVTHGYWLRANEPEAQLTEVVRRFKLADLIRPWRRCIECNGRIESVDREQVWDELEPLTRQYYSDFHRCQGCLKVYWQGSHIESMNALIRQLTATVERDSRVDDETP